MHDKYAGHQALTSAGVTFSAPAEEVEEEGVLAAEREGSPLAVDSVEKTSFSSTVTNTPLSPSELFWGLGLPRISPSGNTSPCSCWSSRSFCNGGVNYFEVESFKTTLGGIIIGWAVHSMHKQTTYSSDL